MNVLDFKKDAGLWHGILTNVMNKLHTISVPYSVMKTCPLSWVQRVHAHKAKVALVKCRDLHWAMMAHRDQRDVSLSSLRMLIVTDGANPCEYAHPAVLRRGFSPGCLTGSNLTPFVSTAFRDDLVRAAVW